MSWDFSRAADWQADPKHVLFTLSRYKFVSKMLAGYDRVLEVGAGDGFASEIVRREVGDLHLTDLNPLAENVAKWDMCERPTREKYSAAYAIDVYEHVSPDVAFKFLRNLSLSAPVGIVGCPSLESQVYASPQSKAEHVNCKTSTSLRESMLVWYEHVFMFSMNDEVLHTGFGPMSHYLFALGVNA